MAARAAESLVEDLGVVLAPWVRDERWGRDSAAFWVESKAASAGGRLKRFWLDLLE